MSLYYKENGSAYVPDFSEDNGDPIKTEQCHKDACDINKILDRHQVKNVRSHLVEFPPEAYGVFDGTDLQTAMSRIDRAREIFDALPSEVRREYNNNAISYVQDIASRVKAGEDIGKLLPAIARPGSYFPNPVKRGGQGAGAATAPTPPADSGAEGASAPESASTGSEGAT